MEKYELTLIVEEKTTAAKKKAVLESIEKIINLFKGKLNKVEDWGVKEMFHTIKGNTKGMYLFLNVEMDPKSVKQLSLKLNTEENILRFLLVKI